MTRVISFVAVFTLTYVCFPCTGSGQTEQEGIRLLEEGKALHDKPYSRQVRQQNLEKYEQALGKFEKAGAEKLKAVTLKEIGHLYKCSFDQAEKALEYLDKSREVFRKIGDLNGEAEVLIEMAKVHWDNRAKALGYLDESLNIVRRLGDLKGEAQVLSAIGDVPGDNTDKPEEYHEQALEIYRKLGDLNGEAQILTKIALHHWDDVQRKIQCYEQALQIYRKLGNLNGEAQVLMWMGEALWMKKPQERREYYEMALQIHRRLGDLHGEERVLHSACWDDWRAKEYRQALECFEKRIQIFRALRDVKGECQTLDDVSSTYMAWGDHENNTQYTDRGLEYAMNATECIKKTGAPSDEIDLLNSVALRFNRPETPRYYEFSTKCRDKALEMAKSAGDLRSQRHQFDQMHWEAFRSLRLRTALEYALKVLEIDKAMGNPQAEYITLQRICDFHQYLGEYQKALECHGKRLEVCRRLGISPDDNLGGMTVAASGFDLGIYEALGQYQKVLESLQADLDAHEKIHGAGSGGRLLASMGSVYAKAGQIHRALKCYREYLAFIDRKLEAPGADTEPPKRASQRIQERNFLILDKRNALMGIGNVCALMGRYDEALEAYQATLKVKPEPGNEWWDNLDISSRWDANSEAGIGSLYLDVGQVDKAEPYIRKAGGDELLGRLFLMKGEYAKAREHYARVLALAERVGSVDGLFEAYTGAGLAYESMSDFSTAADYFQKAVDQTEEQRSFLGPAERERFLEAKVGGYRRTTPYEGLARVRLKLNMLPDAVRISEYTKARLFAEAISRRQTGQRFDVPAEILTADNEINDGLAAVKKLSREQSEKGNMEAVAAIDDEIKNLEARRDKHMMTLREKYPLFAATRYPQPMDLAQTALTMNEYVLAYEVTDSALLIFLMKGKEILKGLLKPVPRKELEGLIRKFREPMEVKPGESAIEKLESFDFATGEKLSELLLLGMIDEVPTGASLIIIPDEALGLVPFEMLVLSKLQSWKTASATIARDLNPLAVASHTEPKAPKQASSKKSESRSSKIEDRARESPRGRVLYEKGIPRVVDTQFVGDRHPISYYQSINALTLARTLARPRGRTKRILIVADPIFENTDTRVQTMAAAKGVDKAKAKPFEQIREDIRMNVMGEFDIPRLELTSELAQSLERIFHGQADVLTGFHACKSGILNTIGPRLLIYDKVVFATHGYFGKDLPGIMEPCLVLTLEPPGTDGYLRMTEIMGLQMNADIVALTACQTGLGHFVSGEGTMGMGRAFQYAGAKSVLVSLWSVAESPSVALMKDFFKFLNEGKGKLGALQL